MELSEAAEAAQTPGSERFILSSLGWRRLAERIARRAERRVPAYQEFIAQGQKPCAFMDRPLTSKDTYILRFPTSQLLADNHHEVFAIFRSSGASGGALYWPCLRRYDRYAAWGTRRYLESCFAIQHKRTLAIVADSLGSWVGGDQISWILKSVSLRVRYSFSVFAPGNKYTEIIEIITEVEPRVDQIILFLCPSDIRYLELAAESLGKTLPLSKLRYMLYGEPISERVRMSVQARAGVPPHEPFMLSSYASADTGMLGIESPASVALRKLLTLNEGLASELGFSEPIPHLFHYCAPDAYLETMGGELCVTRWQGIPIVRYNLHDRVRLYRWRTLRKAVLKSNSIATSDEPLREVIRKRRMILTDLIAVEGRTDALILCGSKFPESMLDEAVRTPGLESVLTGIYKARLGLRDGQQFLEFDLELRPGVTLEAGAADRVYDELIQALCRVQAEFRYDWEDIYRAFDRDHSRRILQLRWHPWPTLSQESETLPKRSSIQT
jgi:phenylacetate-CoA ligase